MAAAEAHSWVDVGSADSVAESGTLSIEVEGVALLLVRCDAQLYAIEDRCTHDGEPLEGAEVESCQIICPRHGAHFCVRTGEALSPPAYEPLRTYLVRVAEGRILVESPL